MNEKVRERILAGRPGDEPVVLSRCAMTLRYRVPGLTREGRPRRPRRSVLVTILLLPVYLVLALLAGGSLPDLRRRTFVVAAHPGADAVRWLGGAVMVDTAFVRTRGGALLLVGIRWDGVPIPWDGVTVLWDSTRDGTVEFLRRGWGTGARLSFPDRSTVTIPVRAFRVAALR